MAPICLTCRCKMRCERNGQLVNDIEAGIFRSTYWRADVYRCHVCGHEIVAGIGRNGRSADEVSEAERARSITFAHHPRQLTEFAEQFDE